MRLRIYAIAAFGVCLAGPAFAQAYDPNYPVCMHVYGGRLTEDYIDCSFTSIPQCQATASGRSASCSENPFYAPPEPPKRRGHRRRHHAH
ncbi:DUF3551 domain-containing protein [Bradyrhizobium sp. ISRA443]|uniref:DUF3551 domain-containing protein n=1 Tax=unclassified Bradyrhizobium TaxID=2631580 RepID=UPI00247A47EA|nr:MULTISPECIES: DUF3551 domain-containing protein [unclassified Bradyrhizobium]WGR90916.1 DUF3551 domain-containing protein [Bradyrhizobium sp. ISRA435]WGS01053.1 DUF3551 domain-containing protein [Bradyrhizobium sp. ISRA436]WGS07940.1 DUF3551 domain-containing protein [Bradyrhizobium sp. ISRA437]WGS14828.1 DUF3551 domain-containing protein [Bradyrhizobium sp. ISRA443]